MLNKKLRRRIIEQGLNLKHGHLGSALSCLDVVKYLYDNILKVNDVFILSKAHGAMALYSVFEEMGIKPNWENIHLDYDPENGVEATTGSLGHGLPIAVGRAYGKKLKEEQGNVYVLCGDGEMQEGTNWEALIIARKLGVDNLTLLVDYNRYQALESIATTAYEDWSTLRNKLQAFGCRVATINGHDEKHLDTLRLLRLQGKEGVEAIILETVKGKGVKYLEQNPSCHVLYMTEHPEIYKQAMKDLK